KASEAARAAVAMSDKQLDAIDARLAADFKEYAELANPKPLGIAATQALLRHDEALVLFLDVPQFGKLPEEGLAWVVSKEEVGWRSIPLGSEALSDRVAALRCGLDASSWTSTAGWPNQSDLEKVRIHEQEARRARCKELLGGRGVAPTMAAVRCRASAR